MAFKKVSELLEATGINEGDLFLLVDVLANQSKKVSFNVLQSALSLAFTSSEIHNDSTVLGDNITEALNNIQAGSTIPASLYDIMGRYGEGSEYSFVRGIDGFVNSISTPLAGGVTKTWDFSRDISGLVQTIHISTTDSSYDKTYSFVRDIDGFVSAITIS